MKAYLKILKVQIKRKIQKGLKWKNELLFAYFFFIIFWA